MKNCFSNVNQLWTEMAVSAGMIGDLAGSEVLTAGERARLTAIKSYGVANPTIGWDQWKQAFVVNMLRKALNGKTTSSD
jgi:hypothetical protein